MQKWTLLLIEERPTLGRELKELLAEHGFSVVQSSDRALALDEAQGTDIDLLLLVAAKARPGDVLEFVNRVRQWRASLPFILIACESSEELAIGALKAGISDYFKWPLRAKELIASLKRHVQHSARFVPNPGNGIGQIVGGCKTIEEIRACISRLASVGSNVLVTGETGTGKELVAEMIHRSGPRGIRPFVCINCAAIPDPLLESEFFGYEKGAFTGAHAAKPGKLRMADGGTVFFDEIGDLTAYGQAKLLRTIENKEIQPLGGNGGIPVDFRVIAATNQDLEQLSSGGKFRRDLYFRLNVGQIHLPPLRERKEDIPVLIEHYIRKFNQVFGRHIENFSPEALSYLIEYDWPGNIRELRNMVEATFVNLPVETMRIIDLPEPFRSRIRGNESVPATERDHLLSTLLATNWNKSKTAEKLDWSRMTVYRKVAKYKITREVSSSEDARETKGNGVTSSNAT